MAFAREIQDFISAFSAIRGALGTRSEREMERESHRAKMDYMRAQTGYMDSLAAGKQPDTGLLDYARQRYGADGASSGGSAGGFDPSAARQAIANIESSGGDYSAVSPPTDSGNRAYGKYQVMDFNIPTWTARYVGRSMSPQEFLRDPAAQEAVFEGEFGRLVREHGSVADAASIWFTGRPYSQVRGTGTSDGYTDVDDYVSRFVADYERLAGGAGNDALEGNLPVAGEDGVTEEDIDALTAVDEDGNYVSAIPEEGPVIDPAAKDDLYVPATANSVEVPNPRPRPDQQIAGGAGSDRLAGGGGFDPLPQTSGHLDPVSRAGHDDLAQLTGGRNTPPREVVKNALNWGVKMFGLGDREAIDDGSTDAAADAYISGHGAANVSQIEQIQDMVREHARETEGKELTESEVVMRSLGLAYDYYLSRGEGEKAQAVAFSILQTYRQMSQRYMAIAQAAVEGGDIDGAVEAAVRAYTIIPDGRDLSIVKDGDGYAFRYTDEETGAVVQEGIMSPQEIGGMIMKVSPADFDQFIIAAAGQKPVDGGADAPSDAFTEFMGGEEPMAIDPNAPPVTPAGIDGAPAAAPAAPAAEALATPEEDPNYGLGPRPVLNTQLLSRMSNEEQDNARAAHEVRVKEWEFEYGRRKDASEAAAKDNAVEEGLSVSDLQTLSEIMPAAWDSLVEQGHALPKDDYTKNVIMRAATIMVDKRYGNVILPEQAVEAAGDMVFVNPDTPAKPHWTAELNPKNNQLVDVQILDDNYQPTGMKVTMPIMAFNALALVHERAAQEATAALGARAKEEAFRAERDKALLERTPQVDPSMGGMGEINSAPSLMELDMGIDPAAPPAPYNGTVAEPRWRTGGGF